MQLYMFIIIGFAKHSSVPSYRLQFRAETLQNEKNFLELK